MNRIVTKVRKLPIYTDLLLGLLTGGVSLLLAGDSDVFEVEAIDKKSGAKAIGYGSTEEEATFQAVDKLTSNKSFRKA